jgi:hypothetical protein
MYLLLLVVFPLLFLVNPYLAMVGLVAGIAGLYFQRTQPSKHQADTRRSESGYKAGYED